jgi:hypothetical protein
MAPVPAPQRARRGRELKERALYAVTQISKGVESLVSAKLRLWADNAARKKELVASTPSDSPRRPRVTVSKASSNLQADEVPGHTTHPVRSPPGRDGLQSPATAKLCSVA